MEGGSLQADPPGGASRLAGKCHATIPQGAKAFMYVLCLEPSPAEVRIQCRATVNGNAVPIKTIQAPIGSNIPARTLKELPLKPWVFFRFEVPEGKSEVAISLQAGEQQPKPFAVQSGWWLWVEQPLQKKTLTMEFDQPLPSAPVNPLPFPAALEFQRQVLTLQPLKGFL